MKPHPSVDLTSDQLNVTWFENLLPVVYNPEIDLPDFQIERMEPSHCHSVQNYSITMHGYRQGGKYW